MSALARPEAGEPAELGNFMSQIGLQPFADVRKQLLN
jgi:hypothetical protein